MLRAALTLILVAGAGVSGTAHAQRISSNFGMRSDPFHKGARMHAGMDMAARTGTPVYATGDGYVRRARVAGGYGNLVEMEHGFGYQSRFGHLSRILVGEGQFVRRGTMIGLVGSTGRSTGPHLHYEVRIGGKAVQPARYMQIAFTTQPDWNQVRMAAASIAPRSPVYTAPVRQLATARRVQRDVRGVGDLEMDYGSKMGAATGGRVGSGFSAGHSSFGPRR
jgi:hypothetical protein